MPVISNPVAKELVYGGHLLALGTASIAASSAVLMGKTPTIPLLIMAYLFSFGAYMVNRGSEVAQDSVSNPIRTNHLRGRAKHLKLISLLSFLIGYIIALLSGTVFFLALIVPLVLALLYSVGSRRLTGLMGARRLKEKLLVKNLVISFGWSLVPVLVGLYYRSLTLIAVSFAPFIFLRLMSNTIFFDSRDVVADKEFGVRTIPVVYGKDRAIDIMNLVDALSAFYIVLLFVAKLYPGYSLMMLILPVYSVIYRQLAKRPQADLGFLCDIVADGEYLLWGPLTVLGSLL